LYLAAKSKNLEAAENAVKKGAMVNWVNADEEYKTALHVAAANGDFACVCLLLDNGGDVNMKDALLRYEAT
jgi:ankyrin repeat protein